MNYRSYSNTELLSVLTNEPEPKRFIEASKEFIQRYNQDQAYSQDQLDDAKAEAREEGYVEARTNCRKEMAECIQGAIDRSSCDLDELLGDAQIIG